MSVVGSSVVHGPSFVGQPVLGPHRSDSLVSGVHAGYIIVCHASVGMHHHRHKIQPIITCLVQRREARDEGLHHALHGGGELLEAHLCVLFLVVVEIERGGGVCCFVVEIEKLFFFVGIGRRSNVCVERESERLLGWARNVVRGFVIIEM